MPRARIAAEGRRRLPDARAVRDAQVEVPALVVAAPAARERGRGRVVEVGPGVERGQARVVVGVEYARRAARHERRVLGDRGLVGRAGERTRREARQRVRVRAVALVQDGGRGQALPRALQGGGEVVARRERRVRAEVELLGVGRGRQRRGGGGPACMLRDVPANGLAADRDPLQLASQVRDARIRVALRARLHLR